MHSGSIDASWSNPLGGRGARARKGQEDEQSARRASSSRRVRHGEASFGLASFNRLCIFDATKGGG